MSRGDEIPVLREEDILYQNGDYWVCKNVRGDYVVFREGFTHATRCALFGRGILDPLGRARAECDRRAGEKAPVL